MDLEVLTVAANGPFTAALGLSVSTGLTGVGDAMTAAGFGGVLGAIVCSFKPRNRNLGRLGRTFTTTAGSIGAGRWRDLETGLGGGTSNGILGGTGGQAGARI